MNGISESLLYIYIYYTLVLRQIIVVIKFLRKSLARKSLQEYKARKSLQEANKLLKGWKQSRLNKYVMVKNNSFQITTLHLHSSFTRTLDKNVPLPRSMTVLKRQLKIQIFIIPVADPFLIND